MLEDSFKLKQMKEKFKSMFEKENITFPKH